MSMEAPAMETNEQDIEAARELLENDELLKEDDYAREIVDKGGVLADGTTVDLGNFLAARQGYLMSEVGKAKYEGLIKVNPELMAASSVRPDIEKYL